MITFGVRAPQRQLKLTLPGTATVRAAKQELEAALGVPVAAQTLCRSPSVRGGGVARRAHAAFSPRAHALSSRSV